MKLPLKLGGQKGDFREKKNSQRKHTEIMCVHMRVTKPVLYTLLCCRNKRLLTAGPFLPRPTAAQRPGYDRRGEGQSFEKILKTDLRADFSAGVVFRENIRCW